MFLKSGKMVIHKIAVKLHLHAITWKADNVTGELVDLY